MSPDDLPETTFTRMTDATAEDYATILRHSLGFVRGLPERILRHLALLAGDTGGYAVDRLTHSLQTATRAHRDGRDEEYVVCALVHDIGDTLPLDFFEPMVRQVFAEPKRSIYLPSAG